MTDPADQMRAATQARYELDHPDDSDGAVVAGYIAALRVTRAADSHGILVQSSDVRAAMCEADIEAVERWISANWAEVEEAVA